MLGEVWGWEYQETNSQNIGEIFEILDRNLAKGKHWNSVVSSLSSVTSPAIPPSMPFVVIGEKWGLVWRPRHTGAHQAFRLVAFLWRFIWVFFGHFYLISHNIGSTKIPVQPLSISKKREFDWVTRSKAPASMKNPFLSFDLKITWSRNMSWPAWLKLRQNQILYRCSLAYLLSLPGNFDLYASRWDMFFFSSAKGVQRTSSFKNVNSSGSVWSRQFREGLQKKSCTLLLPQWTHFILCLRGSQLSLLHE